MPTGIYTRTKFMPLKDRLLRKTLKTETCWLWQGCRSGMGHGQIQAFVSGEKKLRATHRVSWEIFVGPIPEGLCVLHKCDVPNCVNPDHLFLGTKADNTKDMIQKGRQKKGVQLPHAKLTEDDVRYIKQSSESNCALGRKFNVHNVTIFSIRSGKNWSHITCS